MRTSAAAQNTRHIKISVLFPDTDMHVYDWSYSSVILFDTGTDHT